MYFYYDFSFIISMYVNIDLLGGVGDIEVSYEI